MQWLRASLPGIYSGDCSCKCTRLVPITVVSVLSCTTLPLLVIRQLKPASHVSVALWILQHIRLSKIVKCACVLSCRLTVLACIHKILCWENVDNLQQLGDGDPAEYWRVFHTDQHDYKWLGFVLLLQHSGETWSLTSSSGQTLSCQNLLWENTQDNTTVKYHRGVVLSLNWYFIKALSKTQFFLWIFVDDVCMFAPSVAAQQFLFCIFTNNTSFSRDVMKRWCESETCDEFIMIIKQHVKQPDDLYLYLNIICVSPHEHEHMNSAVCVCVCVCVSVCIQSAVSLCLCRKCHCIVKLKKLDEASSYWMSFLSSPSICLS